MTNVFVPLPYALLLADFEWTALIPVIVLILYGLGQVLSREGREPAGRGRPAGRAAGGAGRDVVVGQEDPRDEVERFLREVAARRRATATTRRPPDVEMLRRAEPAPSWRSPPRQPTPSDPSPSPPSPARLKPQEEAPLEAQVLPESLGSSIAEHVRRHLGPAAPLDHRTEHTVHEHLDHTLGSLGRSGEIPQEASPTGTGVTHPWSALLQSPPDIRQAIVLSEILSEPVALRQSPTPHPPIPD